MKNIIPKKFVPKKTVWKIMYLVSEKATDMLEDIGNGWYTN